MSLTKHMGVRLPDEQFPRLDAIAQEQCNSRSGIVRLAVEQFISAYDREKERRLVEPDLFHKATQDDEDETPLAMAASQQPVAEGSAR